MNNYLLLCKKIKQMNLENTSKLSNKIIDEYQSDFNIDTFASEKKFFSKDDFIFNFIIVKRKMPKKNSDSNHLNYSMQKKYCSYLFVDHVDEHISILLSNSDSLEEENINFSNWIDFFKQNNADIIFEKIINLIEARI